MARWLVLAALVHATPALAAKTQVLYATPDPTINPAAVSQARIPVVMATVSYRAGMGELRCHVPEGSVACRFIKPRGGGIDVSPALDGEEIVFTDDRSKVEIHMPTRSVSDALVALLTGEMPARAMQVTP